MRALYKEDLVLSDHYVLKNEDLHHLVNVVRIKVKEKLLLLNGMGLGVETEIISISKKEIFLNFLTSGVEARPFTHDVAIGVPKKEALELCLKQATELGLRKIFLVVSDYSQIKVPDKDRLKNVMVSALEQSNARFLPEILEVSWQDLPWKSFNYCLLMDSQSKTNEDFRMTKESDAKLLIIGPEGGFSPTELHFLHGQKQLSVVNLPTPILRTPTALAAGAGLMMEHLLK